MTDLNQGTQNSNFSTSTGSGSFMNTDSSNPPKPDNYLIMSIIGTVLGLCSCIGLVLGIIAIVFATQVDSKYNMGDYDGAMKASNNAKILSIIALVFGVLGVIGNIVYMIVVGGSILSQGGF